MPPVSRKFARPRLLIVGCGDVGTRSLRWLSRRYRVFALTSRPERMPALRALGAVPMLGDLDRPASLRRLGALAPRVLHLAPPPADGTGDPRTRHLLAALRRPRGVKRDIVPEPDRVSGAPRVLVYASTSGVYGDCGGAYIDETRVPRPQSARAKRRLEAERLVRQLGRGARRSHVGASVPRACAEWRAAAVGARSHASWRTTLLRVPGIYGADRLPVARLQRGTAALRAEDDVYTSHIHADDLARIMGYALWRGRPQRVVHASDDTQMKMGDYFDRVAQAVGLPHPPRISRAQAAAQLPASLLSFMRESRRLDNRRLKHELRYRLMYPSVDTLLATLRKA